MICNICGEVIEDASDLAGQEGDVLVCCACATIIEFAATKPVTVKVLKVSNFSHFPPQAKNALAKWGITSLYLIKEISNWNFENTLRFIDSKGKEFHYFLPEDIARMQNIDNVTVSIVY